MPELSLTSTPRPPSFARTLRGRDPCLCMASRTGGSRSLDPSTERWSSTRSTLEPRRSWPISKVRSFVRVWVRRGADQALVNRLERAHLGQQPRWTGQPSRCRSSHDQLQEPQRQGVQAQPRDCHSPRPVGCSNGIVSRSRADFEDRSARGWHLDEAHVVVDGQPMSGSMFDFGLYFFHNAAELLGRGSGPYF